MTSLNNDDYHVGWICALPEEVAASQAMLDEEHGVIIHKEKEDNNSYFGGSVNCKEGKHNIVIAGLPDGEYGTNSAAVVAANMLRTFKNLRFGLMVGIGGGLVGTEQDNASRPAQKTQATLRLGDVVVSSAKGTAGGVIQYDLGKVEQNNKFSPKGTLDRPPPVLRSAVTQLRARHMLSKSQISQYITEAYAKYGNLQDNGFGFPGSDQDRLYRSSYQHLDNNTDCTDCDIAQCIPRSRKDDTPRIFYGTVLSGNLVIKDASERDRLRTEYDALCVEMEAAGLMNHFPCLIIRGICDYADGHKNDVWHNYAALTAAALTKELLSYVSPTETLQQQPIRCVLDDLNNELKSIRQTMGEQEAREKEEAMQKAHQALKICKYESFKNINISRAPRTCQWFLTHKRYVAWVRNTASDLLWVTADPGCGKSVLCRALIDEILPDSEEGLSICWFFFKDNKEQENLAAALCTIIHQLCTDQPHLREHVLSVYKTSHDRFTQDSDQLWRILLDAATDAEARPMVCIIDALDEAVETSRKTLIEKLCRFYAENPSIKLKFLVTSRPYRNVQQDFEDSGLVLPEIRLHGEHENAEIRYEIDLVTSSKVDEITKQFKLSDARKRELQMTLTNMENRTYLWLRLVIEDIRDTFADSWNPEQETIRCLPETVEAAYENILCKVSERNIEKSRRVLSVIVGARRPLTLNELRLALGMLLQPKSARLTDISISRDQLEREIPHWCGLFVFVDNGKVHLIHQTAKEFLLRSVVRSDAERDACTWKHSFDPGEVEKTLATISINYLNSPVFKILPYDIECIYYLRRDKMLDIMDRDAPPVISSEEKETRSMYPVLCLQRSDVSLSADELSFHQYACRYWFSHLGSSMISNDNALWKEVLLLYDRINTCGSFWYLYAWDSLEVGHLCSWPQPLPTSVGCAAHLIAITGHHHLFSRRTGVQGYDVRWTRDTLNRTPLHVAALFGLTDSIQWLVKNGADLQALQSLGGRVNDALLLAARSGHKEVLTILLEAGCDPNSPGCSDNALQEAAFCGRRDISLLLLEHGADPNAIGGIFHTTLEAAIYSGHSQIVTDVMNFSVHSVTDGVLRQALQTAKLCGDGDIFSLLQEHIDAMSRSHSACLSGDLNPVTSPAEPDTGTNNKSSERMFKSDTPELRASHLGQVPESLSEDLNSYHEAVSKVTTADPRRSCTANVENSFLKAPLSRHQRHLPRRRSSVNFNSRTDLYHWLSKPLPQ